MTIFVFGNQLLMNIFVETILRMQLVTRKCDCKTSVAARANNIATSADAVGERGTGDMGLPNVGAGNVVLPADHSLAIYRADLPAAMVLVPGI